MTKKYIEDMTDAEIEAEIEHLKSPFEKILDEECRRWVLQKEKVRRLRDILSTNEESV